MSTPSSDVGSVQGVKEGLSQKGLGLGELIGEDSREELPLPQERRSEAAALWTRREGDNLERGRGFLFSCHSTLREADAGFPSALHFFVPLLLF